MNGDGGFLVEEFLDAISSQLDRSQDALAAKAKVRPLMFALRNFAVELQVFVSMDTSGNVRLRSSAPGETGASTLKLEFTTITRPMVEENTVSLALAQSPSLQEVGLKPEEERRLERIGVRTVGQLQALRASGAGVDGIARLTDGFVPADRLREALRLGRPEISHVGPVPPSLPPAADTPPDAPPSADATPPAETPPVVQIPPGTQRLQFIGRNLLGGVTAPEVRLGGRQLETLAAEDDRLEVALPPDVRGGALEVELGGEQPQRYHVIVAPHGNGDDPWAPGRTQ
jgi:hypothetical protein